MMDDTFQQLDGESTTTIVAHRQGATALPMSDAPPVSGLDAMIERLILDKDISLDRIERVIQMRDAMIAKQEDREAKAAAEAARLAFNRAFIAAKAEMAPIARNAKNPETHSSYANLWAIAQAIDPIIHKHGFSQSFSEEDSSKPNHIRVVCVTFHIDGHERTQFRDEPLDGTGPKGNANKTAVHAKASSDSYARRYLKLMIWDLSTFDDDGNAAGRRAKSADTDTTIGMERALELIALAESVHGKPCDLTRFYKHYKINSMPDLPLSRVAEAKADLQWKD